MCYLINLITHYCRDDSQNGRHPLFGQICYRQCNEHSSECRTQEQWMTVCGNFDEYTRPPIFLANHPVRVNPEACPICKQFSTDGQIQEWNRLITELDNAYVLIDERVEGLQHDIDEFGGPDEGDDDPAAPDRLIQLYASHNNAQAEAAQNRAQRSALHLRIQSRKSDVEVPNGVRIQQDAETRFNRHDPVRYLFFGNRKPDEEDGMEQAPTTFPKFRFSMFGGETGAQYMVPFQPLDVLFLYQQYGVLGHTN